MIKKAQTTQKPEGWNITSVTYADKKLKIVVTRGFNITADNSYIPFAVSELGTYSVKLNWAIYKFGACLTGTDTSKCYHFYDAT